MTFKTEAVSGLYKDFNSFKSSLDKHVADWHSLYGNLDRPSVEQYLGLTFSEYSQILHNTELSYQKILLKELFYIPSNDELYSLYLNWQKIGETPLRFGQYVYNEIFFEFENSYNTLYCHDAFNLLMKGIEFYSKQVVSE